MDLNNLNSFLTVVRFMNFTKAANFLHISQPTLSRQVSALEKELDVKLLIRNSHELRLTPAGKALVEGGADLNRAANKLSSYVSRIGNGKLGSLSVVMPTMFCASLFHSCAYFHEQYPSTLLAVQVTKMEDVFGLVLSGEADVGCTFSYSLPQELDNFGVITVQENTFGIVARDGHPIMQQYKDKVPLEALKHETVFGLTAVSMARNFIAANINNAKQLDSLDLIFPPVQSQDISLSSMVIQTHAELGVACLPYALFAMYGRHLSFREIADLDTRHQILMIFRKDNVNPCLKLFLQIFEEIHE